MALLYTLYPERVAAFSAALVPAFDEPLTVPFITTPEIYREDALKALILSEPEKNALVYCNPTAENEESEREEK